MMEVEETKTKRTSEEDMVGQYQRRYEEIWSVPGGCTVSEKMEKEN